MNDNDKSCTVENVVLIRSNNIEDIINLFRKDFIDTHRIDPSFKINPEDDEETINIKNKYIDEMFEAEKISIMSQLDKMKRDGKNIEKICLTKYYEDKEDVSYNTESTTINGIPCTFVKIKTVVIPTIVELIN